MLELPSPMPPDKEQIAERIISIGGEQKRISCTEARNLAEEHEMEMGDMGALCDELGMKIYACELGCF